MCAMASSNHKLLAKWFANFSLTLRRLFTKVSQTNWLDVLPDNLQSLANLLGLTKTEVAELLSALQGSQSNQHAAVSKTNPPTRSVPQMSVASFLGCFEYTSGNQQGKDSKDVTQDNKVGPSTVALPKAVAVRKGLSNEMTIQLCKLAYLQLTCLFTVLRILLNQIPEIYTNA